MFKWHTYPFVRLVIPLIIGIIFSRCIDINETQFYVCMALCVFLSCGLVFLHFKHTVPLKTILYGNVLSVLIIGIGVNLTYVNNEMHRADYFGKLNLIASQTIIGQITDITPTVTNMRLSLATSGIILSDSFTKKIKSVTGNLLVYTPHDSAMTFYVGEEIAINCKPNKITTLRNPFEFDFAQFWHTKNIHYQCFIPSDALKILNKTPQKNILSASAALQTELSNWLQPYLQTPNEFYVGTALILGAKNTEASDIKNAYIQTGAMHILAVSGMHIILLWVALKWLVGLLIKNKKANTLIGTLAGLIVIWVFACVTGLGASVLRATVMATFLGLGALTNRKGNAINMLAASSFFLLVIDPNFLFDIGFQFSYLAVLSIVVFYPYIFKWFFFRSRILRAAWEITALGFAAQILVTPLSLLYFHRFGTYFWLTGLLAIPVSTVALYAGLLVFLFHPIQPLAWCAGKIFYFCVYLMNVIILKTDALPLGSISGVYLSLFSVVAIYLIIFFTYGGIYQKKLRAWNPALLSVLVLTSFGAFKFQTKHQSAICIYNTPNKTLIDIFSEDQCLTVTNIDTSNSRQFKQLDRATHNLREYKNAHQFFLVQTDDSIAVKKIGFANGILFGMPERWLLISEPIENFLNAPIENIILANNADVSIDSIQKYFSPKKIIIDASNKMDFTEKILNGCKKLKIDVHDIKKKGAYWIDY